MECPPGFWKSDYPLPKVTVMKTESENQTIRMRSYLLGLLPESEQMALEQEFFADSETLEHMQEVEFDLVDSYIRGELQTTEHEQFERHYLSKPHHQERVAVARELLRVAAQQYLPQQLQLKESFWRKVWVGLFGPQFDFGTALATAIVTAGLLLIAGGGWMAIQKSLWHQQRQRERIAELDRRRHMENQIAQQREQNDDLKRQLEQLQIEPGPAAQPRLLSFLLISSARSSSEQQTLKLPAGTDQIRLLMKLESGTYKRYQTNLRQVDGDRSWNQPATSAKQTSGVTTVSVKIPANKLSSGDYILTLTGVDAAGSTEEINRYFFRVANK